MCEVKVCNRCGVEYDISKFKMIKGKRLDVCNFCSRKALIEKRKKQLELASQQQIIDKQKIQELKCRVRELEENVNNLQISTSEYIAYIKLFCPEFEEGLVLKKCTDCGGFFVCVKRGALLRMRCSVCQDKIHKERQKCRDEKYRKTEAYRMARQKYANSEKGKSTKRLYQAREDVKEARRLYFQREDVKERVKLYYQEKKQEIKEKYQMLPDSVVKGQLKAKGFLPEEITEDLMQIQRAEVMLKRKVWKAQKEQGIHYTQKQTKSKTE